MQLLTGSTTDDLDRDVAVGVQTGEPDHVPGELDDPHRVAHVEHVHGNGSPRGAQRARADDQLHGLRDRHEVARHLGIGDGHRAAGGDLTAEDRDDRAGGPQHVAEAHDRVARVGMVGARRLHRPLRERLRRPHHGRRRHRLVGRDEHERLHADLAGDVGHDPRGQGVVAHRLDRVALHHLDVLVGGGVEDHGGPVRGQHLPHALLLAAVGQHAGGGAHVPVLLELAQDREQVVLGVVHENEPAGSDARDLPAQLGADRAAGAGDQHHLAVEIGPHALQLDPHRLAAEHVLDAQLADLAHHVAAGLEELEHRGQRAHGDGPVAAGLHDARPQGPGRRGDGDDHLVGLGLVEDPRKLVVRRPAEHRHTVLVAQAPHPRVVVEEPDRPEAQRRIAQDLAQDRLAARARAHDQHVLGIAGRVEAPRRTVAHGAYEEAHTAAEEKREQEEQHGDPQGQGHRGRDLVRLDADRMDQGHEPDQRERR